ncbi:MAG: hypothetical protein WC356_06740 [Candidatus Micrarchaeia archaeon]|jgi:hypothetical protein
MSKLSQRVDRIEGVLTIMPKGINSWESYELWKLNGRSRLLEANIGRVNDCLDMLFDYLGVEIVDIPAFPRSQFPRSQKLQPRKKDAKKKSV